MIKNLPANAGDPRDPGSVTGLGRSPGIGNGNPPVFLPRKFHSQRSLESYSPWGHKESEMTERLTHNTVVLFENCNNSDNPGFYLIFFLSLQTLSSYHLVNNSEGFFLTQ